MLKFILLGLLDYRAMTGYELLGWINVSTGNFWHAKLSQVYATLKQLEGDGDVISHVEAQESKPDKRVYTITEAGRAALADWLATPITEHEVKKDGLLAKVFFTSPDEKDALLSQLRLQLKLHQDKLSEYRQEAPAAIGQMLAEQPELAMHAYLWEATRRFGEMYETMYIAWLQESIRTLSEQLP
ncbi:MAG: PadR family transcriptional regulator [Anaerolineae bacterium]|nr:PadR family transcriptional regulator [Anaerolineae bacterium]